KNPTTRETGTASIWRTPSTPYLIARPRATCAPPLRVGTYPTRATTNARPSTSSALSRKPGTPFAYTSKNASRPRRARVSHLDFLRTKNLMYLGQVLGGQFGPIHPSVDLLLKFIKAAS